MRKNNVVAKDLDDFNLKHHIESTLDFRGPESQSILSYMCIQGNKETHYSLLLANKLDRFFEQNNKGMFASVESAVGDLLVVPTPFLKENEKNGFSLVSHPGKKRGKNNDNSSPEKIKGKKNRNSFDIVIQEFNNLQNSRLQHVIELKTDRHSKYHDDQKSFLAVKRKDGQFSFEKSDGEYKTDSWSKIFADLDIMQAYSQQFPGTHFWMAAILYSYHFETEEQRHIYPKKYYKYFDYLVEETGKLRDKAERKAMEKRREGSPKFLYDDFLLDCDDKKESFVATLVAGVKYWSDKFEPIASSDVIHKKLAEGSQRGIWVRSDLVMIEMKFNTTKYTP
jgi:hypothetical protein